MVSRVRLRHGLKAETKIPEAGTHRALWGFIEGELDTVDFTGKSVLDIGCWAGYWSFYAERRGADYVLASDDASQNRFGAEGLELAHKLLGSSVDVNMALSVYDLASLGRTFDVILCLGVYYHLLDPLYAFSQIRRCCHEGTVVVFEGDVICGVPVDSVFYSRDLAKAPRFVPAVEALKTLLQGAYFKVEREDLHLLPVPAGYEGPATHRMLFHCTPWIGENPMFVVPPPFGLGGYDPRWQAG